MKMSINSGVQIFAFLLIMNVGLFAQQKPVISFSEKEILLARSWKFILSEEFGLENEPTAMQKNDSIALYPDKKAIYVKSGKTIKGTWSLVKAGNFLYLAPDTAKSKIMFGLKSVSKEKLIIEHQTPDLVRTRYHYEPIR